MRVTTAATTTTLSLLIVAATVLVGTARADRRFKSTGVKVEVENGYYTADVYYKYDESGKNKHYLRYDYTSPTKMIDLIDYSEGIRSKVCTKCEAGYYPYSAPALFKQDGDIATGETEGECKEYTPAVTYAMSSIWYKDDGTLCKATLADGKTLVFSNIDTTFNNDTFFNLDGKQCPAPICKRVMDLVFVVDVSGSVTSNDWTLAKKFMINITNSLEISTDATMIGVVTYDKKTEKVIDLSGDKDKIIGAINTAKYLGGCTCTGCGMDLGMKLMNSTSAARNALNPEKIMMVITDGENNELDYYQFCRKYQSKCTKNGTKCTKYQCNGPTKTVTTPVCKRYENTTQCLKSKCQNCNKQGQCLRNNTNCVKRSTTNCLKRSTTYCMGNPSRYCCSISNGVLSNYGRCGKCECTEYRCDEYACEQYGCDAYDCDDCSSYSKECLIYKQTCAEYETIEQCNGNEICVEYECSEGSVYCVEWGKGANSLLSGAISRTRTPWALYPASTRLPTVFAIGVSGANKYELKGIASTLEGKQLVYEVSDFAALSTIINDLVDETCTKQTDNLELCSDDCHGFCGCEKKCYCPTCDTPTGTCYTIGCDDDGVASTGCVATHETCTNDNMCIIKTADNNTAGCCVETPVNCSYLGNKCYNAKCSKSKGCYAELIEPSPPSPCYNATTCNNETGWNYIGACPEVDKCTITECVSSGESFKCLNRPKCNSHDLCINDTCDMATGDCIQIHKNCTPKSKCNNGYCDNGECYETVNLEIRRECQDMYDPDDPCTTYSCFPENGTCVPKTLDSEICRGCENEGIKCPPDDASKCDTYQCAKNPDGTHFCNKTSTCVDLSNPCKKILCNETSGQCYENIITCPHKPCNLCKCVPASNNTDGYILEYTNNCTEDSVCEEYLCNETDETCYLKTKCRDPKPCEKFVRCDVLDNGEPSCVYENITCDDYKTRCSDAQCNPESGQCETVDNSSKCELYPCRINTKCDPEEGCVYENITCNDNNKCTEDKCVAIEDASEDSQSYSGSVVSSDSHTLPYVCVHKPTCTTPNFCEKVNCSNVTGKCSISQYECDDMDKNAIDECHMYQCDEESRSCKVVLLPSAFLDVCGSCVKGYGRNASLNETFAKTACIGGMKATDFAAAIAGSTIAVIVIVCIIAAVAISVASAIGTKELVKRAKKNAEAGTNSNPLYEESDKESVNPAFTGEN